MIILEYISIGLVITQVVICTGSAIYISRELRKMQRQSGQRDKYLYHAIKHPDLKLPKT